jgi:hypothetical protein
MTLKKDYNKAKRKRLNAFAHGMSKNPAVLAAEAIPGNGSRVKIHEAVYSHSDPSCSYCVEDKIWRAGAPGRTALAIGAASDVIKSKVKSKIKGK